MYHQVTRFKKKRGGSEILLMINFVNSYSNILLHRNHKKSTCKIIHIYSLQV